MITKLTTILFVMCLTACSNQSTFGAATKLLSDNCAKPMAGSVEMGPFGMTAKFECPEFKGGS